MEKAERAIAIIKRGSLGDANWLSEPEIKSIPGWYIICHSRDRVIPRTGTNNSKQTGENTPKTHKETTIQTNWPLALSKKTHTLTKPKLAGCSTPKTAHMCVTTVYNSTVVHNTALNSSDISSYPPDNQHSSDDVCRGGRASIPITSAVEIPVVIPALLYCTLLRITKLDKQGTQAFLSKLNNRVIIYV